MKRAIITPSKCLNCEICTALENCPLGAIFREDCKEKPWVDFYKCSGCMKCDSTCKGKAFAMISQPCSIHGRTSW